MNVQVQLPTRLDKPAFLAWAEGQEGRYELVEGRVAMMAGASIAHGIMILNLGLLLRAQLDPGQWTVVLDFGLDSGPDTLRYPDVMVVRTGAKRSDRVATAPVILIEVLSPSAAEIDLGDKATEYVALPTLAAYLIFSQESAECRAWVRGDAGFPPRPTLIAGPDKIIRLATPQLELPLAAVYAGIPDD